MRSPFPHAEGKWAEVGAAPYPTRRYPGTVLVFPLSFTSQTTMSAAPRGISFTHMRFFLDTEASGSGGRGVREGSRAGRGALRDAHHSV